MGMRLKSYFAGTVEAAMRLARQELGDDAMLMNSRLAPEEARHLGHYEVVFAAGTESPPQPGSPPPPTASAEDSPLALEVAELRRDLGRVTSALKRSHLRPGRFHPWVEEICAELLEADLAHELVYEIGRSIEAQDLAGDPERTRHQICREIEARFTTSGGLGIGPASDPEERRVIALIGPPGAGKTTTLVKLAARYSVLARRPSQILSIDTQRIGAADQLRSYAAILGIGFDSFETVGGLAQVLEEYARKQYIWIDTPGLGSADFDRGVDLARFLSTRPEIETHLVLSCAMKPADVTRVVDRYSVFRPARLLFTQLDETATIGSIISESARTGLPVSFLGCGQGIPDDLETAEPSRLAELVLRSPGTEWRPHTPRRPPAFAAGAGGRSSGALAG